MADHYTSEDARFDDQALNGPTCPKHGRSPCGCCYGCGRASGHTSWCREAIALESVVCPTCPDAKPGCCCTCERPIPEGDQELAPDPFAAMAHGDNTPHLLCSNCVTDANDSL